MTKKHPTKPKDVSAPPPKNPYNCGADSMLRCYNSTEWRLEDWFKGEDEPQLKPAKPPRRK